MNATKELPEITRRIVETANPDKVILFGSHARGDSAQDSDLDLLVIISGARHLRQESIRVRRALRGLLVPVDIVMATPEQITRLGDAAGLVYRDALAEGKVLYERAG